MLLPTQSNHYSSNDRSGSWRRAYNIKFTSLERGHLTLSLSSIFKQLKNKTVEYLLYRTMGIGRYIAAIEFKLNVIVSSIYIEKFHKKTVNSVLTNNVSV